MNKQYEVYAESPNGVTEKLGNYTAKSKNKAIEIAEKSDKWFGFWQV